MQIENLRLSLIEANARMLTLKAADQARLRIELRQTISEGINHEDTRPLVAAIGKNRSLLRRMNLLQNDLYADTFSSYYIRSSVFLDQKETEQAMVRVELQRVAALGVNHNEKRPLAAIIMRNRLALRKLYKKPVTSGF